MKSVREDIKNRQFRRIYFFLGEEAYLRNQYRNTLKDAIAAGDTMNVSEFTGKDVNPKELIELSETAPFLAEYRVIVVYDTNLFKSANSELADYLKTVPETTVFIFSQEDADKRQSLYKSVAANGHIIECGRQNEDTLAKWILSKVKAESKDITARALRVFMDRSGNNMDIIASELEKLLCYTLNKNDITEADVMRICSEQTEDKIFEMIDNMSMGNQKRALSLYSDLLTLKIEPISILNLISRQYNILLQIKALRLNGASSKQMAASVKISPYFVDKYVGIANKYSYEQLKEALTMCADYDRDFKSGIINSTMAVELLIVSFSAKAQN